MGHHRLRRPTSISRLLTVVALALALVACGGGGGDEEAVEPEVKRPPSGDPASLVADTTADPAPADDTTTSTADGVPAEPEVTDFDLAATTARVLCPGAEADVVLGGEPAGPMVADVLEDFTHDLDDDGAAERVLVVSCRPVEVPGEDGVTGEGGQPEPSEGQGQRSVVALAVGPDGLVQRGGPIAARAVHDVDASLVAERTRTVDGDRITTFSPLTIVDGLLVEGGDGAHLSTADPAMPMGLGGLEIGAPYPLLAFNVAATITVQESGAGGECVVVRVEGGPDGVRGLGGDGTLASVEVTNPEIKTDTGLGVGSSADEVGATYGDIVESARDPGDPSREFLVATPPDTDGLTAVFETVDGKVVSHRIGEPGWASALNGCG